MLPYSGFISNYRVMKQAFSCFMWYSFMMDIFGLSLQNVNTVLPAIVSYMHAAIGVDWNCLSG